MKRVILVSFFFAGCYSETIGPYVTEVVVSKDKSHYLVTRCGINLDHGLFGGVSPSKGECTTDKLPPLSASSASSGKP